MSEQLQIRIHGAPTAPTLIYLPGLHGDWTLVSAFRTALRGRARFVEITYPRTTEWSIEDYATGVEDALKSQGIVSGWLLGESFSSQIVWPLVERRRFRADGVILAGGFARHPTRWGVRLAERIAGGASLALITAILFGYAKVSRVRFWNSPETRAAIDEFLARRTEQDRLAAMHRLRLIAQNDPRAVIARLDVPVYALTGLFDPIVPWIFVRRWFRRHYPALREYRIIWNADHNVLSTAPAKAAEQVLRWMGIS